jgi:hypothetical protein
MHVFVVIEVAVMAVYSRATAQCLRKRDPVKGVCTVTVMCVERVMQERQRQRCCHSSLHYTSTHMRQVAALTETYSVVLERALLFTQALHVRVHSTLQHTSRAVAPARAVEPALLAVVRPSCLSQCSAPQSIAHSAVPTCTEPARTSVIRPVSAAESAPLAAIIVCDHIVCIIMYMR